MNREPAAVHSEQLPNAVKMVRVEGGTVPGDRQGRLDNIEYLISVYRIRYMHYVWRNHMPEAGEMERKINRLLDRWQRVRDRDVAEAMEYV